MQSSIVLGRRNWAFGWCTAKYTQYNYCTDPCSNLDLAGKQKLVYMEPKAEQNVSKEDRG